MSILPQYTTSVQADSNGEWVQALDESSLTEGMHRYEVEDEKGNIEQALLYIVRSSSTIVAAQNMDGVTAKNINSLLIPVVLCCVLFWVLALWLARKTDIVLRVKRRRISYMRITLLCVSFSLLVLTACAWWNL